MKVVIAGAGAMGCRFGWLLFKAGHEVLLVDGWKEHIKAIQTNGLEVLDEDGRHKDFVPIVSFSESRGEPDLLIVFTKSTMTETTIANCKHLITTRTRVLTLQNGLGNIEILNQFVPSDRLIAGVTTFATDLLGPGKIHAIGTGETEVMQVDGCETSELKQIVNVLNKADLHVKISANVFTSIWTKVVFNSVYNAICTLTESTVGDFWQYEHIQEVVDSLMNECMLVAEEENIALDRNRIRSIIYEAPILGGHENHMPSMWQDMAKGRQTEIESLNGAIVKRAEKYSIPVPNNKMLYHLIRMPIQIFCIKKVLGNVAQYLKDDDPLTR